MDYYTLWVHQIKTPGFAASQLLVQDRDAHCQAADGAGSLRLTPMYQRLVLQYLRLESFHDLVLEARVGRETWIQRSNHKYALFCIKELDRGSAMIWRRSSPIASGSLVHHPSSSCPASEVHQHRWD